MFRNGCLFPQYLAGIIPQMHHSKPDENLHLYLVVKTHLLKDF